MQVGKKLLAAALTLSLPLAAVAQTPAEPAPVAPAAQPAAPAPAPKKEEVKVTPYGFVQLSAYDNLNSFTTKDYPAAAARGLDGGSFLMSARYSRFGVNIGIDEPQWTGATLTGKIEFDFKAGHTTASSTGWYNGLMRLRLATVTASWKAGAAGSFAVLAGQDYGLVNPLFATTITWTADPLFWQAGNLWRRGPQARITWTGTPEMLGLNIAAAVMSPQTNETGVIDGSPAYAVDYGAGNRSRLPDFEARGGINAKFTKEIGLAAGFGGQYGKRRYGPVTGHTTVSDWTLGADADLNVPFLELKGEAFRTNASDDTYQGMIAGGTLFPVGVAASGFRRVNTDGFWAQGILKPIPELWVHAGYGVEVAEKADLGDARITGTTVRTRNAQLAGGIIFNAGKHWKFGAEALQTTTRYYDNTKRDAIQIAGSTQLIF